MHYIIDHHVDSHLYADTLKLKKLELIGSATTLVIEQMLNSKNDNLSQIDSDLALFMSAPLLLDSGNFAEHLFGSKWT